MQVFPYSSLCIFVSREEFETFAKLAPPGLDVFGVSHIAGNTILSFAADGSDLQITAAPMSCIGIFYHDEMFLGKLRLVGSLFAEWSDTDVIVPRQISEDASINSFTLLLSTSLIGRFEAFASGVSNLSRELHRIRSCYEQTLTSFREIESFITATNVQPCRMTFENSPDVSNAVIQPGLAHATQILPVSTRGLSVIQVHLQDVDALRYPADGIVFELSNVEDGETHGTWRVQPNEIQSGWLALELEAGLSGPPATAILTIRCLGTSGCLPPFSLGTLQPLPNFRLRGNGADGRSAEIAQRSLAIRTWSGLPGVRPPGFAMHASLQPGLHEIAVPFHMLRTAKHVPASWRPGFEVVSYLEDVRGLHCHPPPSGVTMAVLEDFHAGPAPCRVSARVALRNQDSNPVEFAMVFTRLPAAHVGAWLAGGDTPAPSAIVFSGWSRVRHPDFAMISLIIGEGSSEAGKLLFLTRMADGLPNAFAWTSFSDVRRVILDVPAIEDHPVQYASPTAERQPLEPLLPEPRRTAYAPPGYLAAVECISSTEGTGGAMVRHLPGRKGILCHPPRRGITLARLKGPPTTQPFRLLSRLDVDSERAGPVEFCVVSTIVASDAVAHLLTGESGPVRRPDLVFSGWKTASHGDTEEIELDTEGLEMREIDLYLATRMRQPSTTNKHASSCFTEIKIEVCGTPDGGRLAGAR